MVTSVIACNKILTRALREIILHQGQECILLFQWKWSCTVRKVPCFASISLTKMIKITFQHYSHTLTAQWLSKLLRLRLVVLPLHWSETLRLDRWFIQSIFIFSTVSTVSVTHRLVCQFYRLFALCISLCCEMSAYQNTRRRLTFVSLMWPYA